MKKLFFLVVLVSCFYADNPTATIETNRGDITVELYPNIAPDSVKNFLTLAKRGYYNNTIFHRVIKGFMIQGGDPTGTGRGGESIYGATFKDEFKPNIIFDKPGLLAMANRGPNTNGSQFFITVRPTPHLNGRHTIFGRVIKGYEVVTMIENSLVNSKNQPIHREFIKTIKW
jgi:peptidylprolyl isomerase